MQMGINEFSAKEAINILDEKELAQIFKYFGDEKDSNRIAHNIVEDRATREITTEELVRIIESSKRKNNSKTHSATKVFQALRIFVNKEISELIYGLINAAKVVKKDGVIAVVTFHSLEDRIVKYFLKACLKTKVFHGICQREKIKLIYLNLLVKNPSLHLLKKFKKTHPQDQLN